MSASDTSDKELQSLRAQLAKAHRTLAAQKRDLANQHMERSTKTDHIIRLRRILVNALENAPGWQDDARRETRNFVILDGKPRP